MDKKYIIIFAAATWFLAACAAPVNIDNNSNINDMPETKNDESVFSVPVNDKIRHPAVAGQFYPRDPESLRADIRHFLDEAAVVNIDHDEVRAIMAPHAGYAFSGQTAAYAYKQIEGRKIGTVVIICDSHTARFSGIAIDDSDTWETPLGTVAVDKELGNRLARAGGSIAYNGLYHEDDHTLEVQLPFLQTVIRGEFKILPVLFGGADRGSHEKLAVLLKKYLSEDDLVVISTDMSHYPDHDDASRIDRATLDVIRELDVKKLEAHISRNQGEGIKNEETLLCGIDGVKTLIELAGLAGWGGTHILKYANSGDVSVIGDKSRVVGYGAMIFADISGRAAGASSEVSSKNTDDLNEEQKDALLKIAKETVETFVRTGGMPDFEIRDERLNRPEGAFVTLSRNGQLRGCIGIIIPTGEPLWTVVREMAVAAASEDNRFLPIEPEELNDLEYEISVLSVPEPIKDWRKIEMGKHGVIVKSGFRSGVFLPQVAEHFHNNLEAFLSELCAGKAGLPRDYYKEKAAEISVFTAQVF
ncbi:MAG: AmmeMemoRadiSam system protein B [Candidatus Falkowbacteria bacterium]